MGNFYYDGKGYPRWRDSDRLVHRDVAKAKPGEDVHHVDGNKGNFRFENLEKMGHSEHAQFHARKRRYDDW